MVIWDAIYLGTLGCNISAIELVPNEALVCRHWVNSVSDIYGQDEIEELLQDLNRLELATLDTEKFQVTEANNQPEQHIETQQTIRYTSFVCRSLT